MGESEERDLGSEYIAIEVQVIRYLIRAGVVKTAEEFVDRGFAHMYSHLMSKEEGAIDIYRMAINRMAGQAYK